MKPTPAKLRTLDLRPLIARGEEPREKILTMLATLRPGESLMLVTPFLPAPLIERQQAEGVQARPERRGDGSWQTLFWRD